MHEEFQSPTELKKLMDTFKDKLPDSFDFQVGYVTKKGSSKRWIEQEADLTSMYKQLEGSETVTIFCDGKHKEPTPPTRKRKRTNDDPPPASDHEGEIKQVANDLSERHGSKWNHRQYQIWARMHVNNQWDSLDEPPNIPLISGGIKISRKETLSETLSGAAVALVKALTNQNSSNQSESNGKSTPQPLPSIGVSPASKARLSREYITQLKELQDLRECGVLNEDEFQEQKKFALNNLRKMNST